MSAHSPGPSTVTGIVYLEEPIRSRIYGLDRSIAVTKQVLRVGTWVTFVKEERTCVDLAQDDYDYLTGAFEAVKIKRIAPLLQSERLGETVKCTGKVRRLEWHSTNNYYRAESLEVGRVWIPPDNAVVDAMRQSRSVSLKVAFCLDWTRKAFFAIAISDEDDKRFRLLDEISKELALLIQGGSSPHTQADLLVDRFASLRAVDESRRHSTTITSDDNNNAVAPKSARAAVPPSLTTPAPPPRVPLGPRRLLCRPTDAVAPAQQHEQKPSTSGLSAAAPSSSEVPPTTHAAVRVKTVPFNLLGRLSLGKPPEPSTSTTPLVLESSSATRHEAATTASTSVVQSPLVTKSILRKSRPNDATSSSRVVRFSDANATREISDDDDVQSL